MSEKPLCRRIPVNRRIKPSHTSSPSTHKLRRKLIVRNDHSKLIKRCNSEPTLLTDGISISGAGTGVGDDHRNMTPPCHSCFMVRNRIISKDVFLSSPELLPNSPLKSEVIK